MIGAYETRMIDLRRGLDRTTGAVESMRGGARDREICNETLLALSELKQTELSLVQLANLMAVSNEKALAGERIDAAEYLPRPAATH